jgi:hypothetical protein
MICVEAGELCQVDCLLFLEDVLDEPENFFGVFLTVVLVVVFPHTAEVETFAFTLS